MTDSPGIAELGRAAHSAVVREDWIKAWQLCNALLNHDPDRPEFLYLMGCVLRAQGHVGLSYQALRRALAGEQRHVNVWMTYAATLDSMNRWEEAIDAMKVAVKLAPNDDMPLANIAAIYLQEGRWRESLEFCQKAFEINPENKNAHVTASLGHLSMGRWQDAWKHAFYNYGYHVPMRVYNPPEHEEPMWDGTKGQTVVVQADQGVGDIIMYAQCLPQLAKDCKTVILECAPRLVNLFRRNFPQIQVVGTLKEEGQSWASALYGTENQIDAHVHISYLGNWYRRREQDFPRKPYLTADPKKVQDWKDHLAHLPRPWTGITWKGGIQATQHERRSIELNDLAPIIKSGGTMIDLSYQDNRLEVSRWNIDNKEQIFCPDVNTEDYENTVALISSLDQVVTVTTTVVHVCGALGRTAKVLVPSVPQWRYAYRCEEGMIWYPEDSVWLCRQKAGEDLWGPAINRCLQKTWPTPRDDLKKGT